MAGDIVIIPSSYTADETTLEESNNQFSIKDDGVDTSQIKDDAVTLDKINADIMEKVASTTLTEDTTDISFDGLNLDDNFYIAVLNIKDMGGASMCSLFYNDDTTRTHYDWQRINASSTTLVGQRANYAWICNIIDDCNIVAFITGLKDVSHPTALTIGNLSGLDNIIQIQLNSTIWRTINATVTKFTFHAGDGQSNFKAGSIFTLYKIPK